MILVIGNARDPVTARLDSVLRRAGAEAAHVDERRACEFRIGRHIDRGVRGWQILGGDCAGSRPVTAIFVRHGMPASADDSTLGAWRRLRAQLDLLLLTTTCPVVNRPASAAAFFSKPYQLRRMAAAGFRVPRTLVTNDPAAALRFIRELGGRVIFKGVSNLKTWPQILRPHHLARLPSLAGCPTQFQEFIGGDDYRVTVVGDAAIVQRVIGSQPVRSVAGRSPLPEGAIRRCVRFTRQQGIVLSGIDLRVTPEGRIYAFELNPFPLVTHYESKTEPHVTERIVEYLSTRRSRGGDVRA